MPPEKLPPRTVGLTGGIACGKSTALGLLAEMGAETIDADRVYGELLSSDASMVAAITAAFGPRILAHGAINRAALASLVFSSTEARAKLNAVTHPVILAAIEQRIQGTSPTARGPRIVIIEAALIIESGWYRSLDALIVVSATLETRVARLMARNHLSAELAHQRIAAQLSDAERRVHATWVLTNDSDVPALSLQVHRLWQQLISDHWPPRRPTIVRD